MQGQTDDAEIEEDRQRTLADLELPADRTKQYDSGTMGCHEALHMAHVCAEILERHLLTHPAVVLNPAWYARVWRASSELGALYQDIGAGHLDTRTKSNTES